MQHKIEKNVLRIYTYIFLILYCIEYFNIIIQFNLIIK